MSPLRRGSVAGLVLAALSIAACSSSSSPPAAPAVVACDEKASVAPTDAFAAADVGVYLDATDPTLAPVAADLSTYLGAMWGGSFAVAPTAPDGGKRLSLWLSTSAAAAAKLSPAPTTGYALQRLDAAGATTVLVYAPDAADLAAGAYALLETLGARFFHPKQELVPSLGAPRIPRALSVARAPMARRRGLQIHTLHPIDFFDAFMVPSDQDLADAKRFVDWLVKTGQNFLQFPLLTTVPWDAWVPHVTAILDYAHARGVRVGASVEIWGGSALQNNYVLVRDASTWQAQMQSGLDQLMTLPFDAIDLTMGEFTSTGPAAIIEWLDYGTDYVLSKNPAMEVDVDNHVGNYPQLWVPYEGQTVFYYHLPQYCDARLGENVHTLSIFDMYRGWATYGHPDFHLQHDYLLQELGNGRRAGYYPESAYWISADIDVPLFLPETFHARWLDIHTLAGEIAQKGLPPLASHLEFMSGHEWGYWLTDYLVAKMLWDPGASLGDVQQAYTSAFGSCAASIDASLAALVALQSKFFFDWRLFPYVQGENSTVDLGYVTGLETHPRRLQFEDLLPMTDAERAAFTATVVDGLEAYAAQSQPLEDAIAARCRGSDATLAPWCDELWDGFAIDRLRATHAALLYRATLAYVAHDKAGATSLVAQASAITAQAAAVVARREARYRFPVAQVTSEYPNPTVYPFGYLHEAHTQCYWHRRETQVTYLVENGVPEGELGLETCAN